MSLDDLLDGRKVGFPVIVFLAVATLALVSDGFDLAAIGYVGPELIKQWHVAPAELVPVFSAGIFGLLAGAPLFGFVGDRFGRKTAILTGLCVFGGVTLATAAASSLSQLVALRFLTGLGLGGVIPNVIALVAEVAPKRARGRFVVIASFGVPLGISCPGLVAAGLVPTLGWQVLLLVGGVLPLAVAALGLFVLPESIRFLAQRGDRLEDVRRLARTLRPDLAIGGSTQFVVAPEAQASAPGSPKGLFAGGLALVTPLLWIALAANQMSNFFALTWLPTLLQSAGASTSQAGISASLFSIGGLGGGLCLAFIIDRLGVVPIAVLFLAGAPLVAAIGLPGLSAAEHGLAIAGAGFCVTGINFGMNAVLGMIYPTPVRSLGTGWAHAAGRVGALAAPVVGGALLAMRLPMQELLLAPAAVLAAGAAACATLAVLCVRRFGGPRLSEFPAAAPVPPRLMPGTRANV